jgi:trans-4-hydroxy-L-proline dehydratase
MNKRVKTLRQQSLDAAPTIDSERAELITEFYKKNQGLESIPVQRAKGFAYVLGRKKIVFNAGELIVGERGIAPKSTSTYPEICCHTLADLDTLDTRPKTSYKVSPITRSGYAQNVIPFWQDKALRDRILAEMTPAWHDSFNAGIFTEFMEQRAPGHTVLDGKIYTRGMLGFKRDIELARRTLDFMSDPNAYAKEQELHAMDIAADGIIRFAERHAEKAAGLAASEPNAERKAELEEIKQICTRVPAHPPETFHEALQSYWFIHLGVITELNPWDAFNPGRIDQHLLPFYEAGLKDGTLTKERARELLQLFWIKFNNQPAPPKVGVTAAESGTYTDFATINTGGLKPDGTDGVNEVTYLVLDVIKEMRLLQPSSNLQLSKKNPDRFLKKAAEIIQTGFGQPSIFNADAVVQEMVRAGKNIVDARNGGTSGCVETGAFGKENYNLTGYFNIPKVLEVTLHNGVDPRTGAAIGLKTGDPRDFADFEALMDAFTKQINHFIDIKVRGNNVIEQLYAQYLPVPFLSLLIDDCIATGIDYHSGGARYNTSYIQGVGIGSITDSLSALKYHVFENQTFSMDELLSALENDFDGQEKIRQRLLNKTPKYGNDNDYADDLMKEVFEIYFDAVTGRPNTKGGEYQINLLPTTVHVYFGSVIGALPDGRKAGIPLSEGISPVQGADRKGPTAVIKSVGKMDHIRTGGTLLNQKLTPNLLDDAAGVEKFVQLVRSYFNMDGHHIQFNVVTRETLQKAKANPDQYRDLIVRVAGYSDYFCDLSDALQDEIINRTEHEAF